MIFMTVSCFSEADRTILTACQQRGANRKTFRHVSAQLGNKTAQQVRGGAGLLQQILYKSREVLNYKAFVYHFLLCGTVRIDLKSSLTV